MGWITTGWTNGKRRRQVKLRLKSTQLRVKKRLTTTTWTGDFDFNFNSTRGNMKMNDGLQSASSSQLQPAPDSGQTRIARVPGGPPIAGQAGQRAGQNRGQTGQAGLDSTLVAYSVGKDRRRPIQVITLGRGEAGNLVVTVRGASRYYITQQTTHKHDSKYSRRSISGITSTAIQWESFVIRSRQGRI